MKRFKQFRCFLTFIVFTVALTFCQISFVNSTGQNSKALSKSNDELSSASDSKTIGELSSSFPNETPSTPSHQRQLRKQLRGKQRRLRKLVGEIRGIKAKLAEEPDGARTRNVDEVPIHEGFTNSSLKRTKTSWRRRVMNELKRLNEQIRILSAYKPSANQTDSKIHRNKKKQKLHRNRLAGSRKPAVDLTTTYPSIIITHPATDDQAKIRMQIRRMRNKRKRLKKIKSMWKTKPTLGGSSELSSLVNKIDAAKGEPGYQCRSHKDCRPGTNIASEILIFDSNSLIGSCCHKINSTNSASVCFEHSLDDGTTCANSCQCVHGLNCFRTRKDKLHYKKATQFEFGSSTVVKFSNEKFVPVY